jgi:hypothetical protein
MEMLDQIRKLRANGIQVDAKIGFHSGPVVAGIVGLKGTFPFVISWLFNHLRTTDRPRNHNKFDHTVITTHFFY